LEFRRVLFRSQAGDRRGTTLAEILALLKVVVPHRAYSVPGSWEISRPCTWKVAVRSPGRVNCSSLAPPRSRHRSIGRRSDSTGCSASAGGRDAGTLVSAPPSIVIPARQPRGHSIGPGRPSTLAVKPVTGSLEKSRLTGAPSSRLPTILAVLASPSSVVVLPYSQPLVMAEASAMASVALATSGAGAAAVSASTVTGAAACS